MTASNANYPETLRLLRKYQSDSKEPSGQTFTRIAQELEALTDSHAELVKALEPFMQYLKELRERFPESTSDTIIVGGPYNLTYAHFEKLSAALATLTARKVG